MFNTNVTLLLLLLGLLTMSGANAFAEAAAAKGALFSQRLVCNPTNLVAVDKPDEKGMTLDLDKAATTVGAVNVHRAYNIPDSEVRVSFSMAYSEKKVEISQAFTSLNEKTKNNVVAIAKPWTIDLPSELGVTYLFKSGLKNSPIPPFEVECSVQRTRVDLNCPNCQ